MLVSIIIPTYNRISFLIETVNSILSQTYNDLELIIISDGSTDNTKEQILKIVDSRIQFFELDRNYGYPARARNEGIKLSTGDLIAFCDDDDLWESDKLERQINLINQGYDFIFTNFKFLDLTKNFVKKMYLKFIISFVINKSNNTISYLFLSLTNPIVNSSVLVNRNLISQIKFNESILYRASEDYHLWIHIYPNSKPFYLNQELVKYRVHDNNISSDFSSNLLRCLLIFRDFVPLNPIQIIFKNFGIFFYGTRILLRKISMVLKLFRIT